jgi:hypothetical protein
MRTHSLRKPLTINVGQQNIYYMSKNIPLKSSFQDESNDIVFMKYYANFIDQN